MSRLLFFALCVALTSCSLFEPGGPTAAITVKAYSAFKVTDVVERVFEDDGYKPIQRTGDSITFEHKATKTEGAIYGDWNEGEVMQRVKVAITPGKGDTFRVRCTPFVVRDPHDVSFEDEHREFELFSFHYSKLLGEVRRQCLELFQSRTPGAPAAAD